MLDTLGYDLGNPVEQQKAISDILVEHNRNFDQAGAYSSLPVAAYGVSLLNISASDRDNSVPIQVINHGLGYEPLFILFQGTLASGGISSFPIVDAFYNAGIGDFQFVGYVRGYTDKNSIWVIWNDQLQTGLQSITYLIFSVPLLTN